MPCSLWLNPQPGPCFSFWVIFLIAVCLGEKAFLLLFITVVSSWTDPIPGIAVLPFPLTSSPRPVLAHHVIFIWMWNYCCRSNTEKLNSSAFFFSSEASPSEFPFCPFSIKWLLLIPSTFLSLLPFPCSFSSVQSLSHVRLFATPWIIARQACPSLTPGVHSNSCPSSRWLHPAISSSVAGGGQSIEFQL